MRNRKPSREEAWRSFAKEHAGDVVDTKRGKTRQVRIAHNAWVVIVDTYVVSTGKSSTTYTRARALARAQTDLRFTIYPENVFGRLGKLFGMQDLQSSHPDVDREFIVKGNNESMIRSLLIDPRVHSPLLSLRAGRFTMTKFRGRFRNRPEGIAELSHVVQGVVREPERLALSLDLIKNALNQLARSGAISQTAVDYVL